MNNRKLYEQKKALISLIENKCLLESMELEHVYFLYTLSEKLSDPVEKEKYKQA